MIQNIAFDIVVSLLIFRVCETSVSGIPVIDADGSYLYHKKQLLDPHDAIDGGLLLPGPPLSCRESVIAQNVQEMSKKIPLVTPALCNLILCISMI